MKLHANETVWVKSLQEFGTFIGYANSGNPLVALLSGDKYFPISDVLRSPPWQIGDSSTERIASRSRVFRKIPWAIGDLVQFHASKQKGKITRIDAEKGFCQINGFGLDWWC